jgi:hypothetical protein
MGQAEAVDFGFVMKIPALATRVWAPLDHSEWQ